MCFGGELRQCIQTIINSSAKQLKLFCTIASLRETIKSKRLQQQLGTPMGYCDDGTMIDMQFLASSNLKNGRRGRFHMCCN